MSRLLRWLPALAWTLVIFWLSARPPLLPASAAPSVLPTDKLAHLAAYGLLAVLALYPLRQAHQLPLRTAVLLAILISAGYGALDEWHQSFVPSRCASVADWTADALGALLAGLLYYAYESFRRRQAHR